MGPSLEEILAFLALYGKPNLFRMTNGWYSSLEVLVSGVHFKITSETNHRTPKEAAQCCKDRLEEALHNLTDPKARGVNPPALACETTGMSSDKPSFPLESKS